MANGFNGSRSPVRAINTVARPAWGTAVPRPRSWSEPVVQEIAPVTESPASSAGQPVLECPDCGSRVRLALVPLAALPPRPAEASPHTGADAGTLPDFEETVGSFKRALIERALRENDGIMTRAAKALGLKYTTFVAMVHRLGVDTSSEQPAID